MEISTSSLVLSSFLKAETKIVESRCQKTCFNENAEILFVITHVN